MRTDSANRRERRGDRGGCRAARGMSPPPCADARHLPWLGRDVVDDVVRAQGVTAHAFWHVVELQTVARPPCDVVIRARGVAADAEAADDLPARVIERQP